MYCLGTLRSCGTGIAINVDNGIAICYLAVHVVASVDDMGDETIWLRAMTSKLGL
jgi:NCAIR mutase (PurE)-related protein